MTSNKLEKLLHLVDWFSWKNVSYGCKTLSLAWWKNLDLECLRTDAGENLWTWRRNIIGEQRKVRSEEHHDLYCSPNITIMIKLKWMKWIELCSTHGSDKCQQSFNQWNWMEGDHLV